MKKVTVKKAVIEYHYSEYGIDIKWDFKEIESPCTKYGNGLGIEINKYVNGVLQMPKTNFVDVRYYVGYEFEKVCKEIFLNNYPDYDNVTFIYTKEDK